MLSIQTQADAEKLNLRSIVTMIFFLTSGLTNFLCRPQSVHLAFQAGDADSCTRGSQQNGQLRPLEPQVTQHARVRV